MKSSKAVLSAKAVLIALTAGATLAGCNTPPAERLNAPPQGYTESPSPTQEFFIYMVDNAILSDMSVADAHFVPHSPEINSLGLRRLDRCASLLKVYGGTLNYDTQLSKADLIEQRLANIREYLTTAGVDPQRFDVKAGLPGGRGLMASEAVIARQNAMVKPEESKGGGPPTILIPNLQPPSSQ